MFRFNDSFTDQEFSSMLFSVLLMFFMASSAFGERPKIEFETTEIKVGSKKLTVEVADTPERKAQGLMFREKLEEGKGMLFIFPDEQIRNFWMKNTIIPLSIGFFDSSKNLVDMQDMEPVKSIMEQNPKSYQSSVPAQYALEVPRGWFEKSGIKRGDKLHLDQSKVQSRKNKQK